jgi:hypothetical protein
MNGTLSVLVIDAGSLIICSCVLRVFAVLRLFAKELYAAGGFFPHYLHLTLIQPGSRKTINYWVPSVLTSFLGDAPGKKPKVLTYLPHWMNKQHFLIKTFNKCIYNSNMFCEE